MRPSTLAEAVERIRAGESQDEALAEFVDSRMREISSGTLTVDSLKVAILAALHVADELHRLKNLHEQADAQLTARSAECAEMLDRLLKARTSVEQAQGDRGKISLG